MRALVYRSPGDFSVADLPMPEPGPGQVRIKMLQVGLCGTDLHVDVGEFGARFPLIPGHECVGLVDALGDGVTGLALGEQVTANPNIYCGHCDQCRSGRLGLCTEMVGVGSTADGFFAEYAVVAAVQVFSVEGLHPDVAVFTEPASCAMHGVETAAVRPGSTALVFGAGPTGLLLAQLLATGGAASVTVAEPVSFKRDTARRLGIDRTVSVDRQDPAASVGRLREVSPTGDGYDLVVEATGRVAVGELCVPLARSGGTVLVYGVAGDHDRLSFEPFDVFRREITIRGSFAEMTSFPAAIRALRGGRVRTEGIITHRFGLDDYARALATLRTDPAAHKVLIVP